MEQSWFFVKELGPHPYECWNEVFFGTADGLLTHYEEKLDCVLGTTEIFQLLPNGGKFDRTDLAEALKNKVFQKKD